jgi:hypothetical protein
VLILRYTEYSDSAKKDKKEINIFYEKIKEIKNILK